MDDRYFILNILKHILSKTIKKMKQRIQALIKALKISGRKFNESIGLSCTWNRTIGKTIGVDVVDKIRSIYPQVNINWLVKGEGDMFVEQGHEGDILLSDNHTGYQINKDYRSICEDLRNDNKDLRDENRKLRDTLLELMYKNEKLMIENAQLYAKASKE